MKTVDLPGIAATPRATIHDVARLANVSIGTVSRVINLPSRVNADTRKRVREAVAALDYQVNTVAQSMRTQSTKTIALLAHELVNAIFVTAAQAAQTVLGEAGYTLVLAGTSPSQSSEAPTVRVLSQRRMDGLIVFLRNENDPDVVHALRDFKGPKVVFDRAIDIDADTVLADHAGGVCRATRHLLDLGHRDIALVGGAPSILPGRERLRGFIEAFESIGLQPPRELMFGESLSPEYGFAQTSVLLHGARRPTAIVAAGNQILEGVMQAVKTSGLSVPHDLSLIGFDDSALARLATPAITVISRDMLQMGIIAARMLLERLQMAPGAPARRLVLPTQVVLRDSCAPPRS